MAWRNGTAATAMALLFAIGTTGIPAFHLVFHALPHDHGGGETHDPAGLDDGPHHHHAAEPHGEHHDHEGGREPFDPHHGDGSAAHFSLALGDAPASRIDLVLLGVTEQYRIAPPRGTATTSAHVSVLRFRGPPIAT